MKIRADENVSPHIVKVVRGLALSDGFELTSILELHEHGSGDVHWITRFAQEGGDAVLSGDTDFHRLAPQVDAINRLGLKIIHLAPRWSSAPGHLQAAHILLWWPRIERQLQSMGARECYRPPWNMKEDGELQRIPMDYADAEKKLKRAAQREERAKRDAG